jgi:transposase
MKKRRPVGIAAADGDERAMQVVLLRRQGTSKRGIARALKAGRNTVKRMLADHEERRQEGASVLPPLPPPRPSKLDEYADTIAAFLKKYPDITAQRVFEELRAKDYGGGYTIVREYVKRMRPKEPVISLPTPEYRPGQMAENDWSPYEIDFAVGRRTIQVFGYTLVVSRRKAYSIHASADVHELMAGHVLAFERLGGLAWECKYDGQKAVVIRREGGQPIWNLRFIDFATYYEFTPRLCRPRKPNDKPHVERGFWEFERSFLNGRSFHDVDDMKRQLAGWHDMILDPRVVRGTHGTTLERFAAEAPHLRPLPARPYDTARLVYRLCDAEACIPWDGNDYEVPYEHASDFLPVRITSTQVFIYARDLRCVATHERLPKGAHLRGRLPERRPPGHARGEGLELLRPAFAELGQEAADFLQGLERAFPRYTAHHARKVLALRERYKTCDLVAAIKHALCFGAFDSAAVARIVASKASPRTLDEYVADQTRERLVDWLGECRTQPRSLREYDDLPCIKAPKETPCRQSPESPLHPRPEPHLSQEPHPPTPQKPPTPSCAADSETTSEPSDSST